MLFERYFETKKNQELTKEEIGMLLYFTKSTSDKNYSTFLSRKADISKLMSEDIFNQFDLNIKLSSIIEKSFDEKTGLINDDYFYKNAIPIVGQAEAKTALNRTKVIVYSNSGQFKEYEKAALQYYQNPENFDQDELLRAAWIFSENVDTPSSLKKAEMWAEKSVMKSETAENTYILAKVYSKTGKKENAKIYAETSKKLAESQGKDASLAIKLLENLK